MKDVALLVRLDPDGEVGRGGQLVGVRQGEQADFVQRVRGVRDQLPEQKRSEEKLEQNPFGKQKKKQ